MNIEEFESEYGHLEARFVSYYKYTFTYEVRLAVGVVLRIDAGDVDGDIYRDSYSATELVRDLEIKSAGINKGGKIDTVYQI